MKHEWNSRSEIRMFNCEIFFYFFLAKLVKTYKHYTPLLGRFQKNHKKTQNLFIVF